MALVNDRIGLGFEVETRKDQFPCQFEWQALQAGQYALGIEPSALEPLEDSLEQAAHAGALRAAGAG